MCISSTLYHTVDMSINEVPNFVLFNWFSAITNAYSCTSVESSKENHPTKQLVGVSALVAMERSHRRCENYATNMSIGNRLQRKKREWIYK